MSICVYHAGIFKGIKVRESTTLHIDCQNFHGTTRKDGISGNWNGMLQQPRKRLIKSICAWLLHVLLTKQYLVPRLSKHAGRANLHVPCCRFGRRGGSCLKLVRPPFLINTGEWSESYNSSNSRLLLTLLPASTVHHIRGNSFKMWQQQIHIQIWVFLTLNVDIQEE